ncbi:MAG: DUF3800 domain-containing protein [Propionibacteriaceae bacterium]|jgi:hypothetical protein|nr:DUF3800 domain-containing protein [Propionibacteriaceae bacterium]
MAEDSRLNDAAAATNPEGALDVANLDESYSNQNYYVAVVVVTPSQQRSLSDTFAALREDAAKKFGTPPDVEFHAYDIMQGQGAWSMLRGRVGDAASLYRRLLKAIVGSGAQAAIQSVDRTVLAQQFDPELPAHEAAVRLVLEQVDQWRENAHAGQVRIVSDEISSDIAFATDLFARAISGTSGAAVLGRPGPLSNIAQPARLVSSADYDGVQAADLIAHIARRHFERTTAAPRAVQLARSLYHTVMPAVAYQARWSGEKAGDPEGSPLATSG